MKKPILVVSLAVLLCFTFACQNKAEKAELEKFRVQAKLEEQNEAAVIRLFEEIDKQNFDVFDEQIAEDAVTHFPPYPDVSHEAQEQLLKESYADMPDYTHTIEDIIAKGDKVVVRLTNRGTDKLSGKKIEFPVIWMGKIVNGKVVETWIMVDYLGQAQQLGMELKPIAAKK
jgi:ketosteroid isomerase-like protein